MTNMPERIWIHPDRCVYYPHKGDNTQQYARLDEDTLVISRADLEDILKPWPFGKNMGTTDCTIVAEHNALLDRLIAKIGEKCDAEHHR